MGKKKILLYGMVVLFTISGVAALPSGNITGGIGCIVIAIICFLLARKPVKEIAGQQVTQTRTMRMPTAGSRIAETIRTKVVGVTFKNDDGESRQDILSRMTGDEEIEIEKTTYNGEPAAYVKWDNKIVGYLSAELARDLAVKYPNARYSAEILEISGREIQTLGCNIELDVIVEEQQFSQCTAGETEVYIDRNSKKYHSKPDCSGMKNPKRIPLSQAKKKYTACKKCCK